MESAAVKKAQLTLEELTPLNEKLEQLSAREIILWAHKTFGTRLCVLSAFQEAGCALCHMVAELGLQDDVDVVFVDTGVNFQETLDTVKRIGSEYGLNIVSLHPERTMEEQTREEGVLYLDPDGQKRCCALRKKEPLKQIKGKYDAMLGSLRRVSGGRRALIKPLALDMELNMIRVHPLVNLAKDDLDAYIKENNVIVNPLHAQGFPTVSCNRCTTPVLEGEDERAGRWRHLENAPKYCNINPTDRAGGEKEYVEFDSKVAASLLSAGL